jgi:hypothetical protein
MKGSHMIVHVSGPLICTVYTHSHRVSYQIHLIFRGFQLVSTSIGVQEHSTSDSLGLRFLW